jgi:hypothetical protein
MEKFTKDKFLEAIKLMDRMIDAENERMKVYFYLPCEKEAIERIWKIKITKKDEILNGIRFIEQSLPK